MKKIIFILVAVLCTAGVISARDAYLRDSNALPVAAQAVLKKNFKSKVSLIKVDKDFGRISEYEVILTDGSEVSFDRDGNWKSVEVRSDASVPKAFILAPISRYVQTHHKGTRIVGIERSANKYEVELSDGVDIEFALDGAFKRYD